MTEPVHLPARVQAALAVLNAVPRHDSAAWNEDDDTNGIAGLELDAREYALELVLRYMKKEQTHVQTTQL